MPHKNYKFDGYKCIHNNFIMSFNFNCLIANDND